MLGDDDLVDQALCAFAAATDSDKSNVDLSYSYVMRELRKGDSDRKLKFQKAFKKYFDEALYEDVDDPSSVALTAAMKDIDFEKEEYA